MSNDTQLRLAASEHVKRLAVGNTLTSEELRAGFHFDGGRVPLINPQRGIFKPRRMEFLLSVRTVYPRSGARIWYDDQRRVHEQIERGDDVIDYAFMGTNPDSADNRWLREACDAQVPVLYFLGVAPGRYTAIWPTYIAAWSATELKVLLAFGASDGFEKIQNIPDAPERRYGLRLVRQRLHQAVFREAVLTVDPDYRVHINEALLAMNDGPLFEHGIKAMAGRVIRLPKRTLDYPDRDRLAERFDRFAAQ